MQPRLETVLGKTTSSGSGESTEWLVHTVASTTIAACSGLSENHRVCREPCGRHRKRYDIYSTGCIQLQVQLMVDPVAQVRITKLMAQELFGVRTADGLQSLQ
eukprot:1134850-Pelagomonas_calceolata.AAC.1